MTGIMDTNFFYYFFGITTNETVPDLKNRLLASGIEWKLSDIAYLETICHYRENENIVEQVHSYYRENSDKIKNVLNDSQMDYYLSDVKLKKRKIKEIYDYKIRKESMWLLSLFKKVSQIYKDYSCEEYQLTEYKKQIEKNFISFWKANEQFVCTRLITNEMKKLYETEDYRLHRILRTHLFTILFAMQWNLVAGIDGVDPGKLRDKMEMDGFKPVIPNQEDVDKILATINFGCEDEDGNIMQDPSRLFTGKKFRAFLDRDVDLNGSEKNLFKKEAIKRIYNNDACIQKNDYWDLNFLNLNADEYVLTFDVRFLNLLQIVKKSMYDDINKHIEMLKNVK